MGARGWVAYGGPGRAGKLAGLDEWLGERFSRHCGNAEVVRQDLKRELSINASLRTVQQALVPHRARTNGKDENGVRYLKRNAIAGHRFDSLVGLEGHICCMRDRLGF